MVTEEIEAVDGFMQLFFPFPFNLRVYFVLSFSCFLVDCAFTFFVVRI